MNILVVGATGATGRLLVGELLARGHEVKVIVRSAARLPNEVRQHDKLTIVEASLLDLSAAALTEHVRGVDAVASCLGHNLTFKGVYGHPRRLVTDAMRQLSAAIRANAPEKPVKMVLMNTTGNRNRDLAEPIPLSQRLVVGVLRLLLPPHVDNEQAADYLRTAVGQDDGQIEWVVVRPDGLIDEGDVTAYDIYPSPIRNPIFDAGQTSRINVGHFMAELMSETAVWQQWRGQMPVIYNAAAG